MDRHVLSVCTSCASAHRTKQAIRHSGGERLLAQLQALDRTAPIAGLSIEPNQCLGACDRHCAISFNAPEKYIYVLGDLPVDDEQLASTATAVMKFASQYYTQADGTISYLKCPALLKQRIIAKIPPL